MQSKITIFKKKIEIDDEQNRLGPNNRVNLPMHKDLFFKTNPRNLLLKMQGPRRFQPEYEATLVDDDDISNPTSSSDSGSIHSYRSKIAQNDAIMNKPNSPIGTIFNKQSFVMSAGALGASVLKDNGKSHQQDAERLIRQKSMAPVKDWTSTVTRRLQNNKHGYEATKKHYEREAVAKYIFNKFGVHLLTFN